MPRSINAGDTIKEALTVTLNLFSDLYPFNWFALNSPRVLFTFEGIKDRILAKNKDKIMET